MFRGGAGANGAAAITSGSIDGLTGVFRQYNGAIDATNYERGFFIWSSNQWVFGSENGGTGLARDVIFKRGAQTMWQAGASLFQVTQPFMVTSSMSFPAPVTNTGSSATVGAADNYLIANVAGTQTVTLPTASTNTGRRLVIRTITANTVVSASSNVVPLAGGAAAAAILAATAGKWAELVSDGTNWQIMAGN